MKIMIVDNKTKDEYWAVEEPTVSQITSYSNATEIRLDKQSFRIVNIAVDVNNQILYIEVRTT